MQQQEESIKSKKTVFWWKRICLHLQQFTVLKILSEMKENSVLKKKQKIKGNT